MWSSWTGSIQKRVCRYLLQRYLGQYLREKITLAQLTIDLYNGTGTVKNVSLDCHALNGLAEQHNLPIEFIEGHLETISISVPWSTIMQDSCEIEITGLQVTIQPKKRVDNGGSMIDSMFTSMASSMQLAEECLKTSEEIEDDRDELENPEPLSGLEHCAQTIDAVLSRVKMCFRDTVLRVEKYQGGSDVGFALEFHIKLWRYSDESCQDTREDSRVFDSAFSHKKIVLEGVTCYSDIYSFQQHQDRMEASMSGTDLSDEAEQDNSVLIANFSGQHEVGIQVKMDDSMGGPQISVDCSFGSVIALLSPIQAHIIYKLIDEILNPAPTSSESMLERRYCKEKPMDLFDFKRVEEELLETLKPGVIGLQPGLTQQQGWSSACYDDSDDEFQPLKTASKMYHSSMSNFMNSSVTSMASSMQQSVSESLVSSTIKSAPYNYQTSSGGNTSAHSSTDKTKFNVSFASAAVILLHEDILTLSSKDAVLPDTLKEMREFSRKFFQSLSLFGASVKGQKDVDEVRGKMNSACTRSHHRIIAAPIKIDGLVKGTTTTTETNGYLTLGYCEVLESLRDQKTSAGTPNPECIEVITFPRNFEHGNNSQSLKMEFKVRSYKGRSSSMSDTILRFRLQECHCEFDMSIVDRINSLLNSKLPYYTEAKIDPVRNQFHVIQNQKTQSVMKISVKCPSLSLNFRFPIPDLRPIDDANRVPYWIRNLQNDSIVLQVSELEFVTALNSAVELLEFDTKCHEARLFYKELPGEKPVLFATALADDPNLDGNSMRSQGLDWPRLLVWIYPERSSESSGESESTDNEGDSIADAYLSRRSKEPSPFSSKRIVHETLSSQEDENSHNASESVIPGDRSEMNEFIEAATKNTLFKVELNLRFVEVSFPSKHLFEEIYNRVGNDLLLWEPSRVKPSFPSGHAHLYSRTFKSNSFSMCQSAIRLDHDSDSEEEMSAFYTPSAGMFQKPDRRAQKKKSLGRGQSEVTFYLTIGNGIGSFYTPLKDLSGNIIPGQKGQLTLKVEQGCLFVVSSYKGDSNLGYLCLASQKAEMYHSDLIRNKELLPRFCSELVKTIYPSDNGVLTHRGPDSTITDGGDMLSVAIRIERDPLKNLKTFKLATGIREGTLDHKVYLPNRSWFTQLTDFFDVTDTPVIGYTPSTVLTELHLHLWNCAIDYRPLNISLRSVLTMETFSISSNIAAQTSTSVIRFMSEDAAFYLTTKLTSNDLRNDYVCVMDMDFFELCLRLCTNRNSTAPRIDLTASSNVLNIRTCSDSFKSLLELLTYYTNEGDLLDPCQQPEKETEIAPYSPIKESSSEPALITTEEIAERVRRMSVSQTEHVHDLVSEAMQDSAPDSNGNHCFKNVRHKKTPRPLYELHFTPDAGEDKPENEFYNDEELTATTTTPLPGDPIMESTNGFPIEIHMSDEDEEEFCILENDPGVGIVPKSGEPEARVLSDEPIHLIENHFSPPEGKMDILKAPKRYPKPVMKYSLKEMSIIWHLYGGEDFGTSPSRKSSGKTEERGSSETLYSDSLKENPQLYYDQSDVDLAIDALNPGVVYSKTKAFESAWEAYESPKNQRKQLIDGCTSWRRQGGKGRNREVSIEMHLIKIKLVHESYPETTEQASRQVIVINNVEILDKLRSSQFNKMMHLYTSPTRPKQTHANMVMIKAAHVRPDPQLNMEECSLKISILPLRLNIDQDALLFIYQFFSDLSVKSDLDEEESVTGRLTNPPSHTPSVESLPVMTVNLTEGDGPSSNSDGEDVSNLLMFNDDPFGMEDNASTCSKDPSIDSTKPTTPIYFRQVIFSPEVPIRLDYRGKRMDMTHGPLAGILMGLAQLNCSEIRLKRISHPHGILGLDRLAAFLINDWTVDIKKNQLPSLLGGVGPMHSFVQLFQGMKDLIWLPIEQYQKDGRIAKGLQRGVNAFSTSTAMAALELTNKLIQTIQGAAEFTYDMVSPGPSVHQKRRQSSKRKRYRQPGDIREGMNNAYNVVKEGLGDTAQTIVRVASKEHEQKGISGAVGGVLRQIPPTMVRPIIVVAEATSNVLDGFRSQLEPEFKKENEEKWKET